MQIGKYLRNTIESRRCTIQTVLSRPYKRTNVQRLAMLALLLYAILLTAFSQSVQAATTPVSVQIPVTCAGKNTSEAFTVCLKMLTPEFQTPDRTKLMLSDGQTEMFSIQYVVPGTYEYEIYQEAGSDMSTSYDKRVYSVDVYVTETEDGKLEADPVVYLKGKDEKLTEVRFENEKRVPAPSKAPTRSGGPKTGDSTDMVRLGLLFMVSALGLAFLIGRKIRTKMKMKGRD